MQSEAGRRHAEADAAQDAWLSHRRWCGYCHTHSQTLCPLGKVLLDDHFKAHARLRDLHQAQSMALMRLPLVYP